MTTIKLIPHNHPEFQSILHIQNAVWGKNTQPFDKIEENNLYFLAIRQETPVGFAVLQKKYWSLKIKQLAVHPEKQGLGIGKEILNYLSLFAFNNNYETIVLDSHSQAQSFYRRCGYTAENEEASDYFSPHDLILMYLKINAISHQR